MIDLMGMIRKRFSGPGWHVFEELSNSTGSSARRRADAVAFGIWPSRGHALIGIEIKRSRGDVQKELDEPRKADAVGKFMDEWWLVVESEKIIDGLVIPSTWGVLAPRHKVLRVVRKAPSLSPASMSRGFAAAMIQHVLRTYVPRADLEKVQAEIAERAKLDRSEDHRAADHDLEDLREMVAEFEEKAGIKIHKYDSGRMGEAVRLALDARNSLGQTAIENQIRSLERTSEQHERLAATARNAASSLRAILQPEQLSLLGTDAPPKRVTG